MMRIKKFKWGNPLFVLLLACAGLFGIGAQVATSLLNNNSQVVNATTSNKKTIRIYTEDQNEKNWSSGQYFSVYDDGTHDNLLLKITDVDFEDTSGYEYMNQIPTSKIMKGSLDGSYVWYDSTDECIYAQMIKIGWGNNVLKYHIELPWIFESITYTYKSGSMPTARALANDPHYTVDNSKKYCDYISHGGNNWWDGVLYFGCSHVNDGDPYTDDVGVQTANFYDAKDSTSSTIGTESVLWWTYYDPTSEEIDVTNKDFDAWYQSYNSSTHEFSSKYTGPFVWNASSYNFYGNYTAAQKTMTYSYENKNGDVLTGVTCTGQAAGQWEAGVAYTLPTPSKAGYIFEGWHVNSASGDKFEAGASYTMPNANTTLVGVFYCQYYICGIGSWNIEDAIPATTVGTNTATFNNVSLSNGNSFKIVKYTDGSGTQAWQNGGFASGTKATSIGFSWSSSPNYAANNITLTAAATYEYTISVNSDTKVTINRDIEYTIYDVLDGGDPTTDDGNTDETYNPNISHTGYSVKYWTTYSAGTYSNEWNVSTSYPTGDTTIYAVSTPITYSITYKDKGGSAYSGSNSASLPTSHTYATDTNLVAGVKTGYRFDGWFINSACTGDAVTKLNGTGYTANITLYAKWTANTYTVLLNNQSATTPGATSVTATYDSTMPSIAANLPTKNGYNFQGYFTEAGGSGTKYYNADGTSANTWDKTTNNFTLYAHWTNATYSISYNLNGGSAIQDASYPTSYTFGTEETLPTKVKRDGYAFQGWYLNAEGTGSVVTTISTTDYGNKIFYAKWEADAAAGYYIVGDKKFRESPGVDKAGEANWTHQGGIKMSNLAADDPGGNTANLIGVELDEGALCKMMYYPGGTANYEFYDGHRGGGVDNVTLDGSKNYVIGASQKHDFYLTKGGESYINNRYTISYKCIVDGVEQTQSEIGTITYDEQTITSGYRFSQIIDPSLNGCEFEGWYSDADLKKGLSNTYITWSGTVYAKFNTKADSTSIYFAVDATPGESNQNNGLLIGNNPAVSPAYTYVKYWVSGDGGYTQLIKVKEYTAISVTNLKFFILNIPNEADGFLVSDRNNQGSEVWRATIDLHIGTGEGVAYSNGKNMFYVTYGGQTKNAKRTGSWNNAIYQLEIGNSTFSSVTTKDMTLTSDTSTGNVAELMGVEVESGQRIRARLVTSDGASLSATYNITKGGEEGDSSAHNYSEQEGNGVSFTKDTTVNIYISGTGTIFLVDVGSIEAGGYLYIAYDYDPSSVTVQVVFDSTTSYEGSLGDMNSVEYLEDIEMSDGVVGMIKVPVFNLRGRQVPAVGKFYTITFTETYAPTKYATIINVEVRTDTPLYYVSLTSTDMTNHNTKDVDDYSGAAANYLYNLVTAIQELEDCSVCNFSQSEASVFVDNYNDLSSDDQAALSDAYIHTWSSVELEDYSRWSYERVHAQLVIAASGNRVNALHFGGLFSNTEDGFSTIIIIIASSISLLSVTALSILVIKKRKNKEQ